MMFTSDGWKVAAIASCIGVGALSGAGWPLALLGAPVGFAAFTAYAYLRG